MQNHCKSNIFNIFTTHELNNTVQGTSLWQKRKWGRTYGIFLAPPVCLLFSLSISISQGSPLFLIPDTKQLTWLLFIWMSNNHNIHITEWGLNYSWLACICANFHFLIGTPVFVGEAITPDNGGSSLLTTPQLCQNTSKDRNFEYYCINQNWFLTTKVQIKNW